MILVYYATTFFSTQFQSGQLDTSPAIPDLSFRLLGVVAHQQFPEISNVSNFFAAKKEVLAEQWIAIMF